MKQLKITKCELCPLVRIRKSGQTLVILPCSSCESLCENALGLYELYHLVTPELKVVGMDLDCPKTGKRYRMDIPEVKPAHPPCDSPVRRDANCLTCPCNACDVSHADLQCEVEELGFDGSK